MPVKLFSLHNVPDDEAEEVRELLASHDIPYYETAAGNWGVSAPALWLHDDSRFGEARALVDDYESQRLARVREEYANQKRAGGQRTLVDVIRENPARFVVYATVIVMVLYFSTQPFLNIGK